MINLKPLAITIAATYDPNQIVNFLDELFLHTHGDRTEAILEWIEEVHKFHQIAKNEVKYNDDLQPLQEGATVPKD